VAASHEDADLGEGRGRRIGTYATAAAMHTVHNARIMLLANLLNTMAGSSFAIGVLTPLAAAVFYSAAPAGLHLSAIIVGIVFWLVASTVLHMAGRMVLGGLRQ